MQKLYIVLINESYVRDTQVLVPEAFPDNFDFNDADAVWDYACNPMNDCWGDCAGGIFIDIVRANSDEDAINFVSELTGYDKRILSSICVDDN